MPRPRRDSEILPAKERLETRFWELLAERNYHKITVTDIVRVADVNRNSFYYHFSDCRNWPIPPSACSGKHADPKPPGCELQS